MPVTYIRSLRKIAQALLLAFAAWVLVVGAASAHGGHTHADDGPVPAVASPHVAHEGPATPAAGLPRGAEVPVAHHGGKCPGDSTTTHGEGCCTIACHAAMAAPGIDAWAGPRLSSSAPMLVSDLLEGRCGDRSERPPRFV